MSDKDISLRSAIFIIIGVLLLLSLVICIYIVNGERDLKKVNAKVIEVKEVSGKNDVTITYKVNNQPYIYNFYYKKDVKANDTIDIYYHENNPISVQTYKTSYIIFICPVAGLVLCIIGLFILFKKTKKNSEEDLFTTQVISVIGNTQKLEIIPDDKTDLEYVKTEEEKEETPVKEIAVKDETSSDEESFLVEHENVVEETGERVSESISDDTDYGDADVFEDDDVPVVSVPVKGNKRKEIPMNYYITGDALIYEVFGYGEKEINLTDIRLVNRTINDEGELIKILVETSNISCIFTKMKKINLDTFSNLLHNKMLDMKYEETITHKNY